MFDACGCGGCFSSLVDLMVVLVDFCCFSLFAWIDLFVPLCVWLLDACGCLGVLRLFCCDRVVNLLLLFRI